MDEAFTSVVVIGRVSEATLNLARNDPGLMLWKRYLARGNEERTESSSTSLLLKLIAKLENIESLYIPPWAKPHIMRYNGTPLLMQIETTLRVEDDWAELSMNLNEINSISRSIITKLRKQVVDARFSVGLTIQGVDDDELPERLLIATRLQHVDIEGATRFS